MQRMTFRIYVSTHGLLLLNLMTSKTKNVILLHNSNVRVLTNAKDVLQFVCK